MAEQNLIPPDPDSDRDPDPESSEPPRIELPTVIRIKYEAPLPPPHMLREFEDILPGAADRIFTLMEEQAHHRQGLENTQQTADIASEGRGIYIGAILGVIAILASFVLIYKGKSIPGTIAFITTCASFIGVFIAGRLTQKREREGKFEQLVKQGIIRALKSGEPDPEGEDWDTES